MWRGKVDLTPLLLGLWEESWEQRQLRREGTRRLVRKGRVGVSDASAECGRGRRVAGRARQGQTRRAQDAKEGGEV